LESVERAWRQEGEENVSCEWVGVLRGIFRPKREEAAGDWRKLHNEELYDMY
jgi:hypothetical protein